MEMDNTNNQSVKSKRDTMRERLSSRYPDLNMEDDEAVAGRINDDYDDYDRQLNDYKGREEALSNMFNADPRSANFIANWHNGSDPAVELVRQFGTDIKDAIDDPDRQEQIAAANKEYVERVAKSKELESQYAANIDESLATLDAFQSENGLDDAKVDQVMEFLQNVMQDALVGKFSRESMDMALKAIDHDEDVAVAEQDAEVRGRNAKINEKLRTRNAGDGTAALQGKNNRGTRPAGPDLGALNRFDGNDDIFSRGGEKRIKRT
jgi:hypothetical protein